MLPKICTVTKKRDFDVKYSSKDIANLQEMFKLMVALRNGFVENTQQYVYQNYDQYEFDFDYKLR